MLTLVRKSFPAWMLGVLGGAGALTAMVPAAVHILTASTLFSKNLYRPIFAPDMTDDQVARLARIVVVVLSLVSLLVAIYQLDNPGVAVALGIRRGDAILSRRRARHLLEACDACRASSRDWSRAWVAPHC